ncbi:MAG: hypothetical protein PHZ09_12170 [Eubacteriales bacterium]|jgi:hypothetical protein|nr:hypothetical protein [Eubacteriales bacterium]
MKAYIDSLKCASDNRICKPLKECPTGAITWIETTTNRWVQK